MILLKIIIIFIEIVSVLIFEIMLSNATIIIVFILNSVNNNDNMANIDKFNDEENIDNYTDKDHNDFDFYLKYEDYILIVNINIITII